MTHQVSSLSVILDHNISPTATMPLLPYFILSASLTRNVFGPANDDDQFTVSKVTKGGERALGCVGLQRVRHGK